MTLVDHNQFMDAQAAAANRLIDYYEGRQLKYVQQALDGQLDGGYGRRHNWQKRGYVPRMRNVVKPIVEKSAGQLFTRLPTMEILPAASPTAEPIVDARFNELMMVADLHEFAVNWNVYSRLLKSICVLQQKVVGSDREIGEMYTFDETEGDTLVLTMLHRGNSIVTMNATRTAVTSVAYLTLNSPASDVWAYRLIDGSKIYDVMVTSGVESVIMQPNVDGFVPAIMHYDAGKPRAGVWCHIPEDIRSLQEMVNSHITDMEFALALGKAQTLFTNAKIVQPDEQPIQERVVERAPSVSSLQPLTRKTPDIGGIGSIVHLAQSKDGSSPMVEYKGPNADLTSQDAIIQSMVSAIAEDWSVNLKVGGDGSASSGFQLIVEELDNLTLREQRVASFVSSFRRFYNVTQRLYPELTPGSLQVKFGAPNLPVNQVEVEELWTKKIEGGRATVVDYLMATEGLNRDEAILRYQEIRSLASTNPTTV